MTEPYWGVPVVIAALCATVGTMLETRLVVVMHATCLGDDGFAGGIWVLSRFALFPSISVASAAFALPFAQLARLPWGWARPVALALTVAVSFAGPMVLTLHDLADFGACA
ncbi:hypothetical protein ACIBG8_30760 [Nonomuraea sp. NPDC050556]|uniref:hypothetical protein n=1 Tax=Nonomuraea sp. NPDC050556 TaxID=3364369 RepID=UPI0037A79135